MIKVNIKYLYRLPRSESFFFHSLLPSALVAWEHSPCSVPCGFAARMKVAALKHYQSGVVCRAVNGINVSVKPVCLRL